MGSTERLDRALVSRGLASSRSRAQSMILAGSVRVDGAVVRRPAVSVAAGSAVTADVDPYVSRAAHKLLGALDDLSLTVAGRALDAGSSTGGFTQVLLERGCRTVYAVDVGTDQLAPSLRDDPRVLSHERTNLRDLQRSHVGGEPVDLVVADVSFISLTMLVGPLTAVTERDGWLLLMVKPQFEVGRERLGRGGVVRSPDQQAEAVRAVADAAEPYGWSAAAVVASRLPGPAGNREFFLLLRTTPPDVPPDIAAAVALPPVG